MTLSYASGPGGNVPLTGETIGAALADTVARHGGHEALVEASKDRRWSYAELDQAVTGVARGLLAYGVLAGDRIGLWAPSSAEWVMVQLAAARVGAILVSLNPAYAVGELAYALGQSGASVLIAASEHRGTDCRAVVSKTRANCPELRTVVHLDDASWHALLAAGEQLPMSQLVAREATLSCDDPINIQYTSGTTGFPKGATLSHHSILNNARLTGALLRYTERDRICVSVPLYHTFGMVVGVLAAVGHGACVVIPAPTFDPAATLYAIEREQCTALYGVPTMFIAELNHPDFATRDLSTLRTGIMGGSPCPAEVVKRVIAELHMDEVAVAYGMTETSPIATQTLLPTAADSEVEMLERRTQTVGVVHPHLELKVIDPATRLTLPRGERGELCVRGYSVMLGYWEEPERTAEVIDAARWMHTGDLAVMRADGYVQIVGRIKDMIIRGGENIYPREVEEFLHTHPKIADVQVVGVPDEKYGEEIAACVILAPGAQTLTVEEVATYCDGHLARFKTPRLVRIIGAFPLTASGKVRKGQLREETIKGLRAG
ncbi:AMP-binding protein [Streptomyces zagrosensis]|uniref:Fatty-acyl-CoA synthase n=1 Tax=Streptomyces zagrosensis TaxID=1042984 RepID=A0A7W9QA45_9ACTN|nr:AMP-binding protein [Streptomyces zagrosensis]MBB5936189.1 fatty-acyl-CoA synthase [Streptomyces zagrosensis]